MFKVMQHWPEREPNKGLSDFVGRFLIGLCFVPDCSG